jgi:type II secretory pathway pseudopilin PulG
MLRINTARPNKLRLLAVMKGRIKMSEIRERRTVIHDIPVERPPAVESEQDYIIHERRGMSGTAVAAIVIAAIAGAVLITLLIINSQQQRREDELAIERERAAAERRAAEAQSTPQQSQPPQVVVVPQPPPSTVTVPVPVPSPSASGSTGVAPSSSTSNLSIEIDVNGKLLDDPQLRSHPITVRFENGSATLSGSVPSEELKARAEKIAMSVKGVRHVINNITVEP